MAANYTLGDRLILRRLEGRTEDVEVVVYKAGRKWGYAKPEDRPYPDVKFDLETGHEDAGMYASRARVLSAEQDAAEKVRAAVMARLKALGVGFGFSGSGKFSTEALERVADLLERDVEQDVEQSA